MQQLIIVGIAGGCIAGIVAASSHPRLTVGWITSVTCWIGLLVCMFLLHGCKEAEREPIPKTHSGLTRIWVYQDIGDPFPAYFLVDTKECVEYLSLPPAPPVRTRVSRARPCDLIPYRNR